MHVNPHGRWSGIDAHDAQDLIDALREQRSQKARLDILATIDWHGILIVCRVMRVYIAQTRDRCESRIVRKLEELDDVRNVKEAQTPAARGLCA